MIDVEGEGDGLPDSMMGVGGDVNNTANNTTNTAGEVVPPDWFLSDEQINALKVDPLKKEIKRRGVIPKGKKEHLRVTLKQCVEKKGGLSSIGC